MRRGGGKDEEKVMGPLFPRLHVNDTVKGGPRAPPRNKMALYEQFSVPSHRFGGHAHRGGGGSSAVPSTSASQVGGNERPLFPSYCVPSNVPVRSSEQINTNSNGRAGNATRIGSGRQSTQLKINAAGSAVECSSQRRESNIKNSSGKKLTNDDDFMVPSIFGSGVPPHSTQENARAQEKLTPFSTTSPYKSVPMPTLSKSSANCSNVDKKHLEGMNVSVTRSRNSSGTREKEPAEALTNVEVEAKSSSFQASKEMLGKADAKVSSIRDGVSNINVSDKPCSRTEGHQARRRDDNAMETQFPAKFGNAVSSKPCNDIEMNGASLQEQGLSETGEKRKRSDVDQKDDLSDYWVESLPGLEISPDDVVSAIGPKHFWKARRAIVNQQRVFAVQVFELHRLIKVQKLIAGSPHFLIEGDPCLGNTPAISKNKLADGNLERKLPSAKNIDDMQPTLQQQEYSKENSERNQPSPSQDDGDGLCHHNQAATDGAFSSNPPTMPVAADNKQNNWCIPPSRSQWLVPVMSPSEGLIYKPYAGSCPPAGSFLAPFYASCNPLSLQSAAGDFMNSAYGIPIPHQPQHMGVPGSSPMPPMYFPPFSLPVMNPVASASAVEQANHLTPSQPNGHIEQHLRSSCNMAHLRSEAFSGIWRLHASMDSELQGSSTTSPFDRLQGEGRGSMPLFPSASVGRGQPQPPDSMENQARVIRVVPHNARTASESAARIFRSIQMERQQNDS